MTWVTIACFAAALAWMALSFLAYRDFAFAFQSSLMGWLICGAVWVVSRLNFAGLVKGAKSPRKLKMLNGRRLAMAGVIVGIFALTVLTAQWLGNSYKAGEEGWLTALTSGAGPASIKQKSPAQHRSIANKTNTQKTERLWSVQVAAFRREQEALKLATALKDRGWEAYVTSADVNAVKVYRIHVGRFRTQAAAERLLLKLKEKEAYTTAFVAGM